MRHFEPRRHEMGGVMKRGGARGMGGTYNWVQRDVVKSEYSEGRPSIIEMSWLECLLPFLLDYHSGATIISLLESLFLLPLFIVSDCTLLNLSLYEEMQDGHCELDNEV